MVCVVAKLLFQFWCARTGFQNVGGPDTLFMHDNEVLHTSTGHNGASLCAAAVVVPLMAAAATSMGQAGGSECVTSSDSADCQVEDCVAETTALVVLGHDHYWIVVDHRGRKFKVRDGGGLTTGDVSFGDIDHQCLDRLNRVAELYPWATRSTYDLGHQQGDNFRDVKRSLYSQPSVSSCETRLAELSKVDIDQFDNDGDSLMCFLSEVDALETSLEGFRCSVHGPVGSFMSLPYTAGQTFIGVPGKGDCGFWVSEIEYYFNTGQSLYGLHGLSLEEAETKIDQLRIESAKKLDNTPRWVKRRAFLDAEELSLLRLMHSTPLWKELPLITYQRDKDGDYVWKAEVVSCPLALANSIIDVEMAGGVAGGMSSSDMSEMSGQVIDTCASSTSSTSSMGNTNGPSISPTLAVNSHDGAEQTGNASACKQRVVSDKAAASSSCNYKGGSTHTHNRSGEGTNGSDTSTSTPSKSCTSGRKLKQHVLSFSPTTSPAPGKKNFVYQNLSSPPATESEVADVDKLTLYQHYVNLLCLEFNCKKTAGEKAAKNWRKAKKTLDGQTRLYLEAFKKYGEDAGGVKKSLCADFDDEADASSDTATGEVSSDASVGVDVGLDGSRECLHGCEYRHIIHAAEYLKLPQLADDHERFSSPSKCRNLRKITLNLYSHCLRVDAWKRARASGKRARTRTTKLSTDVDEIIRSAAVLVDAVGQEGDDYALDMKLSAWRANVTKVGKALRKQTSQALKAVRKNETIGTAGEVSQIFASPKLKVDGYDWDAALADIESAVTDEDPETTRAQLRQAAALIRIAGVVSLAEIAATVAPNSSDSRKRWLFQLIADIFPVLIMTTSMCEKNGVVVDVWSWGEEHSKMTIPDRIREITDAAPNGCRRMAQQQRRKRSRAGKSIKRGRSPIHITYPKLVEVVVDVIMQNQPRSHERRRVDIFYTGVSLANIKKRVASEIPELADIDKRTIARLMVPPRHGVRSAASYKGIIRSKVTATTNDRRKLSRPEDVHFSHAVASFFQQMGAYLGDECLQLSGDEKTPLTLGHAGLVSRRIKNKHITPTHVVVNNYDHDYQTSEYLLALSGFIELVSPAEYEVVLDDKNRDSVKKGTAGVAHLFMRALMYDKPDLYCNVGDLRTILESKKSFGELRPVLSIITDGGDGYKNTRMATILLYGRIFRDFGLEGLILFRRTGGLSAYNNIEHVWSPISSALGGMVLGVDPHDRRSGKPPSACLAGDDLFEENVELFDECMDIVREKLEQECPTYNDHAINLRVVKARESAKSRENMNDDLHNELHTCYTAYMADDDLKATFDEFRTIIRHAQLSTHGIVFTPCGSTDCDWVQCKQGSKYTKSPKWRSLLDNFKGVMPGPCPHDELEDTYLNFLEVLKQAEDGFQFPHPDYHCPSSNSRMDDPRVCTRTDPPCSAHWTHLSANVRTEHDKQFHWDERQRMSTHPPGAQYVMKCKQCGQQTSSYEDAVKHAKTSGGTCDVKSADRQYRFWTRKPGLSYADQTVQKQKERSRRRDAEGAATTAQKKHPKRAANASASGTQSTPVNSTSNRTPCASTSTCKSTTSSWKKCVYDGAVGNFVIPPDDELIPDKISVGQWVFAAWTDWGSVTRGYVIKKKKRKGCWCVRFLNEHELPYDYTMDENNLCLTREIADNLQRSRRSQDATTILPKHAANASASRKQDATPIAAKSASKRKAHVSTSTCKSIAINRRNCAYDGAVDNFIIPPDDERIPVKINVGQWVFAAWTDWGSVTRGYVIKQYKKRLWDVRFLNEDQRPYDYKMKEDDLCLTREVANSLLDLNKNPKRSRGNSTGHNIRVPKATQTPANAANSDIYTFTDDRSGDETDEIMESVSECKTRAGLVELTGVILCMISLCLSNIGLVRFLSTCKMFRELLSTDDFWLPKIGYFKSARARHERDVSCLKGLCLTRVPLTSDEQQLACVLEEGRWSTVDMLHKQWRECSSIKADFAHSLIRLKDGCWLTDEVINWYFDEIDKHNSSVRVMSSFCLTKIGKKGYRDVCNWARRKDIDITHIDVLCFPMNWRNNHWVLSVINFRRKRFEVWDSCSTSEHDPKTVAQFEGMKAFLAGELKQYNVHDDIKNWTCVVEDAPVQENAYDCGVFTCMCAEYISLNVRPLFTQRNMSYFRKRMLVKLAMSGK